MEHMAQKTHYPRRMSVNNKSVSSYNVTVNQMNGNKTAKGEELYQGNRRTFA